MNLFRAASAEIAFTVRGRRHPLLVQRNPRARTMRLRIDPRDGGVRLTLPSRTSLRAARAWVESQRDWIERELSVLPAPSPLAPGAVIPFEGSPLVIEWRGGASRTVRRENDKLIVGGPPELVHARILRWLKREADARLAAETRAMASRAGVALGRVAVGDPRSRWGSCTASGDIRYSWRLILAPPEVREATVAHEVAHRLHMHHGPEFHAAVARLLGRDPAPERRWLRAHGAMLHGVGRG